MAEPGKPCAFCRIVNSETGAAVVLDEAEVLAFLDVSPVFPGHVLVIPREHHQTLNDLPAPLVSTVFNVVQRVAAGVLGAMVADGTWVSMNNTVSQSVPHLHVHVIPRRRKDGLRGFYWPRQKYDSPEAMAAIAAAIRSAIPNQLFGGSEAEGDAVPG